MIDQTIYPAMTCGIFIILCILAIFRKYWILVASALLSFIGFLLIALQQSPNLATILTIAGFGMSLSALITFASISANGKFTLPIKLLIAPIILFGPILGIWLQYNKTASWYPALKETSIWIIFISILTGLVLYSSSKTIRKHIILVGFIIAIVALIMRIIPIYHTTLQTNIYYTYFGELIPEICLLMYMILLI